jgi:uncharacterized protein YuzB (UPF0349 family)
MSVSTNLILFNLNVYMNEGQHKLNIIEYKCVHECQHTLNIMEYKCVRE